MLYQYQYTWLYQISHCLNKLNNYNLHKDLYRQPAYPYLCVGAALSLAFAAGEQISLSAPSGGHLVVPDSLFGQILPHFLQLITGHFLQRWKKKKK